MRIITPKLHETLVFICAYTEQHKRPPQIKVIALHFGITGSAASQRVNRLRIAGCVDFKPRYPIRVLYVPSQQEAA